MYHETIEQRENKLALVSSQTYADCCEKWMLHMINIAQPQLLRDVATNKIFNDLILFLGWYISSCEHLMHFLFKTIWI